MRESDSILAKCNDLGGTPLRNEGAWTASFWGKFPGMLNSISREETTLKVHVRLPRPFVPQGTCHPAATFALRRLFQRTKKAADNFAQSSTEMWLAGWFCRENGFAADKRVELCSVEAIEGVVRGFDDWFASVVEAGV